MRSNEPNREGAGQKPVQRNPPRAGARDPGRGPVRGVVHTVGCEEAPADAPVLTVERALDAAEQPCTRLCSLCGAAAELDPVIKGFDHGAGGA